jgi:hypothetical protein
MAGGRQTLLEQGKYEEVIAAVPQVIIQRHVARMAGLHESTLSCWLDQGKEDQKNNIDSIYAQFVKDYHIARCKVIRDKLTLIASDPDLRAGNAWILERCFREDFGKDSEEIRELRAMLMQILQAKGDSNAKTE